jgi:dimethylglycine dehydrogenase
MSMRLEKNYGAWAMDFREDFTPTEAGLDVFVAHDKTADFVGKAAVQSERIHGSTRRRVNLVIDADDADANGDEPIYKDDKYAGFVTSGGYGHFVKKSFAVGYLDTALAQEQSEFTVEILGSRRTAVIQHQPAHDPDNIRMRS